MHRRRPRSCTKHRWFSFQSDKNWYKNIHVGWQLVHVAAAMLLDQLGRVQVNLLVRIYRDNDIANEGLCVTVESGRPKQQKTQEHT